MLYLFSGGSSGGNIAAAVSLAVRDTPGLQKIAAQFLLNPPLQVDFVIYIYISLKRLEIFPKF